MFGFLYIKNIERKCFFWHLQFVFPNRLSAAVYVYNRCSLLSLNLTQITRYLAFRYHISVAEKNSMIVLFAEMFFAVCVLRVKQRTLQWKLFFASRYIAST
jgi:hypothetical protein